MLPNDIPNLDIWSVSDTTYPSAAKYPTGHFYSDAHVALLHPLALLHSPDTPTPRSDVREKPCTEKILFGQFFDGVEYPPADMKP